ncbi:MAG: hypothetical protein ACM34A_06585 [Bacillota bacterium]
MILIKGKISFEIMNISNVVPAYPQNWPQLMWVNHGAEGGMMSLPNRLMRLTTSDCAGLAPESSFNGVSSSVGGISGVTEGGSGSWLCVCIGSGKRSR